MTTHPKRISAEVAERIIHNVTSFMYVSERLQSAVENIRPVIWSVEKAKEALDDNVPESVGLPRRNLCHLIALEDDQIHVLLHLPQYSSQTNDFLSVMVMEYCADYEGNLFAERAAKIFTRTDKIKKKIEPYYQEAMKRFGGKVGRHKVYSIETMIRQCEASGNLDADLLPLFQGSALELFAFSPYTTVKQRPTLKQAMNPNPQKKEWPAIEVVSLRLPAKRPPSAPTGRKIGIRYEVIEHLRRQPTKDGIKLITIHKHWRGPENAPTKPTRPKVYKVIK